MKIVINACHGGFGLSEKAFLRLGELGVPIVPYYSQYRDAMTRLYKTDPRNEGDVILDYSHPDTILDDGVSAKTLIRTVGKFSADWLRSDRSNPKLVQVVEELKSEASGTYADLKIVEIPDGVEWEIDEYDGREHVAEKHRSWY